MELPNEYVLVEQELRFTLNILLNFLISNIDDESMAREFTDPSTLIEENCFKAIKYSLEIPIVPIRKFLILFYIFLKLLFGGA